MTNAEELTVLEAALTSGAHPSTIDNAIRKGVLPVRWSFGRRLIKRSDLAAWSSARESRRPHPRRDLEATAHGGAA